MDVEVPKIKVILYVCRMCFELDFLLFLKLMSVEL